MTEVVETVDLSQVSMDEMLTEVARRAREIGRQSHSPGAAKNVCNYAEAARSWLPQLESSHVRSR